MRSLNITRARSGASRQGLPSGEGAPLAYGAGRDRLDQLDQLLKQIEEAVQLVRAMLPEAASNAADPNAPASERTAASAPASPMAPPISPPANGEVSSLFGSGLSASHAFNRELLTRRLIRDRFTSIGHVGAGVLMRLLSLPGQFVSREDLAESAGVRSRPNRVVKVYICRLRSALAEAGLPASAIETGRLAYRLDASAVPQIMDALAMPPAPRDG